MWSDYFREELVDGLSEEIADSLNRGASLEDVERGLHASACELSEDEQAALWLFAWSYARLCRGTQARRVGLLH